jgi:hypothetical protein
MKNCFEPENHGRVKHVDVRMHYIREQVKKKGKLNLCISEHDCKCRHSDENLGRTKFCRFRDAMLESINEGDFDDKIHESNIEGDYCEPE